MTVANWRALRMTIGDNLPPTSTSD